MLFQMNFGTHQTKAGEVYSAIKGPVEIESETDLVKAFGKLVNRRGVPKFERIDDDQEVRYSSRRRKQVVEEEDEEEEAPVRRKKKAAVKKKTRPAKKKRRRTRE